MMDTKKNQERRETERVPVVFNVNYVHDGDYVISSTRDISADGMFLFTENPPNISERTTLKFSLGEANQLEVDAAVVWVNQSKDSKDHGMAVKFVKPTPRVQRAILEAIKKVAVLGKE